LILPLTQPVIFLGWKKPLSLPPSFQFLRDSLLSFPSCFGLPSEKGRSSSLFPDNEKDPTLLPLYPVLPLTNYLVSPLFPSKRVQKRFLFFPPGNVRRSRCLPPPHAPLLQTEMAPLGRDRARGFSVFRPREACPVSPSPSSFGATHFFKKEGIDPFSPCL